MEQKWVMVWKYYDLLLSFCCPFCGINIYYDQSRENVIAYDRLH